MNIFVDVRRSLLLKKTFQCVLSKPKGHLVEISNDDFSREVFCVTEGFEEP